MEFGPDPYQPEIYTRARLRSARDLLLVLLNSAELEAQATYADLSEAEFHWEPLAPAERAADIGLPPESKRVWRVFEQDGRWTYDYAPGPLNPSPFTTIAWILCHQIHTAEMYLYCIEKNEPVGVSRDWEDLPVHPTLAEMKADQARVLQAVRAYLQAIPEQAVEATLNRLTPAPWGELRPTYLNLIGGVIAHYFQHSMQSAVRKERIREGP